MTLGELFKSICTNVAQSLEPKLSIHAGFTCKIWSWASWGNCYLFIKTWFWAADLIYVALKKNFNSQFINFEPNTLKKIYKFKISLGENFKIYKLCSIMRQMVGSAGINKPLGIFHCARFWRFFGVKCLGEIYMRIKC